MHRGQVIEQAKSAIAQLDATIAKNKAEYERKKDLLPQEGHLAKIGGKRPGHL